MTRRVEKLGPLPNLPTEVQAAAGANDGSNARDRYIVDLRRCLEEWRARLSKSGDIINEGSGGGGHIIQDEGISLTQRAHLNFIGAAVTAADDLANDATTVTITTGTQNLFETIAVAGQSNIVADSPTDTLTIAAGANITLTTNAGTDTLTIAAASSAPVVQGTHLLMLGDIQAAQDDATIALGLIGASPRSLLVFGGAAWLSMVGGGGGGGGTTTTNAAGGGGGAGESVDGLPIALTAGASYSYSVGAGGTSDVDGGSTTFGIFTCLGGKKGVADTGTAGDGGGARGGTANASSGQPGTAESALWFGGSSGGKGSTGSGNSQTGGGSGGYFTGGLATSGAGGSGGGGGASIYDRGGNGSRTDGSNAGSYGSGGGGAGGQSGTTPNSGGTGGSGYILITWPGGSVEFTSGSGTWTAPT